MSTRKSRRSTSPAKSRTSSKLGYKIKDLKTTIKDLNTVASKKKDNIITTVNKIVKDLTELLTKDLV